ncbi:hypothetical protein [Natronomonas salsuginis]|jgi:hypothetical protein|uniref:hypothetical protein n=1 Tax=Natronomonas salsuginis TaxID=2217661 RepID=UPI0014855027|nr:hypothetical protein [Natronomonas salsuginis]
MQEDAGANPNSPGEARTEPPDGPEDLLATLFRSGRANAMFAWPLVSVLGLVLVESFLDFDRLWILFVTTIGLIVVIPPIAYRDWRVMLPWEVLMLALAPVLVRGLFGGELGTFAYYLSVAGLALIVTVELHMFTRMRMTHWFAVVFVVMTTLASAAAWAVVRWNADRLLGTEFLSTPSVTGEEANAMLMTEFVWVTLAGIVAGVLFDAYFKRRGRLLGHRLRWVIQR